MNILRTGLILFLITAICAVLCAAVNSVTAPRILENETAVNKRAIASVSSGYTTGNTRSVDHDVVKEETELLDGNRSVGKALVLSGKGYKGGFTIIASYTSDGVLLDAKMTVDSETAGLGKKAEEDWYMDLFKGSDASSMPSVPRDLRADKAELVTGATVTFKGVAAALKAGSLYVKEN